MKLGELVYFVNLHGIQYGTVVESNRVQTTIDSGGTIKYAKTVSCYYKVIPALMELHELNCISNYRRGT